MSRLRLFFTFPDPVNENAARVVAGGVLLMSMSYLIWGWQPILWVLAYGFLARVLAGPKLSPLALIANKAAAAALSIKYCPGPPKRFAQALGLTFSLSALVFHLWGAGGLAMAAAGLLLLASTLEAVLGICLGCKIFSLLMRWGLVPKEVCERCKNIWA